MVVHDHNGGRIGCGIIKPHPQLTATLAPYPGYEGDLSFTGEITVTEISDGGEMLLGWKLRGLEAAECRQAPAGVANACGIHIHQGMTCDDASQVGGHYFVQSSDPWSTV